MAPSTSDRRDRPRIHLVFPRLPPAPDGIGDHTACLARALTEHGQVTVWTAQDAYTPIPGVVVHPAFALDPIEAVGRLQPPIAVDPPDWIVLQYNPFSYGRWGYNPYLPRTIRALKHAHPAIRVALMVHEVAPPWLNTRLMLMSTWQLAQLWRLGRSADVIFVAIESWAAPFRRWFGRTPVHHLPVGSNMPYTPVSRAEARHQLGIQDPTFVLGVFGTAHPTRLLEYVRDAAEAAHRETEAMVILYVGPDGATMRQALDPLPLHDAGRVPPDEISRHFAAMDLYLAPFRRGVSTRRGSFMTALQHGVATVSTRGSHTGTTLRQADGQVFVLAEDRVHFRRAVCDLLHHPARRAELGQAGRAFYQARFDWPLLAARLAQALQEPHRLR